MSDEILAEMEARRRAILLRQRQMDGISGAAEAGVFATGRPPELDLVDAVKQMQAAAWAAETKPLDYTSVPVTFDDRPGRMADDEC